MPHIDKTTQDQLNEPLPEERQGELSALNEYPAAPLGFFQTIKKLIEIGLKATRSKGSASHLKP